MELPVSLSTTALSGVMSPATSAFLPKPFDALINTSSKSFVAGFIEKATPAVSLGTSD